MSVKVVNISLEDKEHEELQRQKGEITWRDALCIGCERIAKTQKENKQ